MSTQVTNQNDQVVMQRNATVNGAVVTVFSSVDQFFNCGRDSVEQEFVTLETGEVMRGWEALNRLSRNGSVPVQFVRQ